jgi:gamma-glutamyltranspeptidase
MLARPHPPAVAKDGPDVLYQGPYAAGLVKDINAAGGIITLDDLAAARPEVRQALRASAMGVDLLLPPPPSSAVAVAAALGALGQFDLPLAGGGSLGVHRMVEVST